MSKMPYIACALVGLLSIGALVSLAEDEQPAASTQPAAQSIDYRRLKEVLPESIAGIARGQVEGENISMAGMRYSLATAQYPAASSDQGADANAPAAPSAEFQIMDYASSPQLAAGMAAWVEMQDMSQESDEGITQTTKVGEYPAFLTYQNEPKHGELQIYVAKRFIVILRTDGLTLDQFKEAFRELPLDAIAQLQ
jgi:hypothetical protein